MNYGHAFPLLSEDSLRNLLARCGFTGSIEQVRYPAQGVNNRTYLVQCSEGRGAIVKTRPCGKPGSDVQPVTGDNPYWPRHTRALWGDYPNGGLHTLPDVTRLLREHGSIPVPEVYLADNTHMYAGAPCIVSEWLPGEGHGFVADPMAPAAARQLGQHLARMHDGASPGTYERGFGIFSRLTSFPADAWWPRFGESYRMLIADLSSRSPVIASIEADLLCALKRAEAAGTPDSFPLICIDQAPTHYLRDPDGSISAMVDVEGHLWAPREYELAMVELWIGHQAPDFWAGYEDVQPRPRRQAQVRDVYRWMTWMQWTLCDYTLLGNPARARHMEERLAEMCRAA